MTIRMTTIALVVAAASVAMSGTAFAGSKNKSFNISAGYASSEGGYHPENTAVAGSVSGASGKAVSGGTYFASAKTTNSFFGSSSSATVGGSSFASAGH